MSKSMKENPYLLLTIKDDLTSIQNRFSLLVKKKALNQISDQKYSENCYILASKLAILQQVVISIGAVTLTDEIESTMNRVCNHFEMNNVEKVSKINQAKLWMFNQKYKNEIKDDLSV